MKELKLLKKIYKKLEEDKPIFTEREKEYLKYLIKQDFKKLKEMGLK